MTTFSLEQEREKINEISQIKDCLKRYAALRAWFEKLPPEIRQKAEQEMKADSERVVQEAKERTRSAFHVVQ